MWWLHSSAIMLTLGDCTLSPGDLGLCVVVINTGEHGCPDLLPWGPQQVACLAL